MLFKLYRSKCRTVNAYLIFLYSKEKKTPTIDNSMDTCVLLLHSYSKLNVSRGEKITNVYNTLIGKNISRDKFGLAHFFLLPQT